MRSKWTRELIIRHILDFEANGIPLTVGKPGVSQSLYQAGSRIFGSWRNAIEAAGISPERGNCVEKWPPAKIFRVIRSLARRHRPLNVKQLEQRYGSMLSSARRLFGSWPKAVLAAGVNPVRLQRVIPWTRELVIEGILTRALRNEPLAARSVQPRSLVAAGQRFFGSWSAALVMAGLDPKALAIRMASKASGMAISAPNVVIKGAQSPTQKWSKESVVAAIQTRSRQQKPLNASVVNREDTPLYRAARRHFRNWCNALATAGFLPDDHRLICRPRSRSESTGTSAEPSGKSQSLDAVRLDQPE